MTQHFLLFNMEGDPLSRLKGRLDGMRKERDQLNAQVLQDRSRVSEMEAELARKQAEYLRYKSKLDEKEDLLQHLSVTIRESENAYSKLLTNTDKLLSALEQESSNLSKHLRNKE